MRIIIVALSLLVFSLPNLSGMQKSPTEQSNTADAEKMIEFNGSKKTLLGHIINALNKGEDEPFSSTRVFYYKDSKFQSAGDILNLQEEDLEYIAKKNYVYASFYNIEITRNGNYEPVGALILGSTDEELADKLHCMVQRIRSSKK